MGEISGSHCSQYEDDCLLDWYIVHYVSEVPIASIIRVIAQNTVISNKQIIQLLLRYCIELEMQNKAICQMCDLLGMFGGIHFP